MIHIKYRYYLLRWMTILLFCISIFTNPIKASACDCGIPENANEALRQASAVFTGEVLKIKETTLNGNKYNAVLISVTKTWKGTNDSQVIVYTSWSSCQFDFEVGKEYLLYPYVNKGKLEVINCGRSAEIVYARADLLELGEGESPSNRVQLEDEFESNFGINATIFLVLVGLIASIVLIITVVVWRSFRNNTL